MKQCLLLFTFLCVAILPSFSQQKIDILGNAGKEQEIKLSEVAKSVRVIPLETTEECLLGTDLTNQFYILIISLSIVYI